MDKQQLIKQFKSRNGPTMLRRSAMVVEDQLRASNAGGRGQDVVKLPDVGFFTFQMETEHRVLDAGERIIEARINSNTLDGHGTLVPPSGARLANYQKNPVVLFNHNPDMVIGRTIRLNRSELSIDAQWQMARFDNPNSEMGRMVEDLWVLVREGFIRGYSVGFPIQTAEIEFVREDERIDPAHFATFTSWDLREFSLTPVPSNPDALERSGEMLQRFFRLCKRDFQSRGTGIIEPKTFVQGWAGAGENANRIITSEERDEDMPKIEDAQIWVEFSPESLERIEKVVERLTGVVESAASKDEPAEKTSGDADVNTRIDELEKRLAELEGNAPDVEEMRVQIRDLKEVADMILDAIGAEKPADENHVEEK